MMRKREGDSTEPCFTPRFTGNGAEKTFWCFTRLVYHDGSEGVPSEGFEMFFLRLAVPIAKMEYFRELLEENSMNSLYLHGVRQPGKSF